MKSIVQRCLLVGILMLPTSLGAAQDTKKTDGVNQRMGLPSITKHTSSSNVPRDLAYGAYQRGMYLTAFELALPRAEGGDPAAQTLIAELYESGRGIARDSKKAAQWYALAADAGNREAQFAYSLKLLEGVGVTKNVERSIDLLRQAADKGHPMAMFNYASYLIDERPTIRGYSQALPYLEKAAEYRLPDAYFLLAQIYRHGLATGIGDQERSREMLIRAAKSGVDDAQVELGKTYLNGVGVEKDPKNAFRWFQIAARKGNAAAQNQLAHLYYRGNGTQVNPVESAKWHILASRAGISDPELDRYLGYLDDETMTLALSAANRWPN